MLPRVDQKLGRPDPVFYASVFKDPLLHIVVALIVHIEELAVPQDKVGGEVVYNRVSILTPDRVFCKPFAGAMQGREPA